MHIPFEQLPPDSRVWIYQADRYFTETEKKLISDSLKEFCSNWNAHGNPLKTSFTIEHKHFIILSVDESGAGPSGCSIDGSVRVLKELAAQLNIDLFNRTKVAFLIQDEVRVFPVPELASLFKSGTLSSASITFNNLVVNKADFEKSWKTIAEKSWLVKYLPKGALSV